MWLRALRRAAASFAALPAAVVRQRLHQIIVHRRGPCYVRWSRGSAAASSPTAAQHAAADKQVDGASYRLSSRRRADSLDHISCTRVIPPAFRTPSRPGWGAPYISISFNKVWQFGEHASAQAMGGWGSARRRASKVALPRHTTILGATILICGMAYRLAQ